MNLSKSPGWMDFVTLALSNQEIKGPVRPQEKQQRRLVSNLDVDFSHLFSLLLVSENVLWPDVCSHAVGECG